MERLKNITIIFVLAVGLLNCIALAKRASVRLQEGLYAEEVDGDLDAAIRIYEQVIKDSSAQRSHVAQAMYRQGMCYLKKRDEQQAKAIFAQLVAKFSDQTKIIDKVKPMLEELSNADPAALMPPETLIYIETGSPGRQIETILKMLKGTPFENPLAVLGAGGKSQKSPGDIMAALMNPAMIAEFKKIRGMAIGITGIRSNNPPGIAVLYPGKSDALRGFILAGLGMVGTPGEPIEGMQTMIIAGTAGAAHDDNVVIIAQPRERLTWCVKQYKGITNEPTLASNNKSFAKINKKARQENAITVWANVDEVFTGLSELFPDGKIPAEIRIADGFVDFRNIDDLLSFFSIQESGIASETNIALKNGHHCLAYNMIRTPNLTRAGFEAVPAEAVALVSIALGEVGSAPIVSRKIENLTGLDIGREIFANIEQITLFALPPGSVSSQSNTAIPPIATNLGLAITSHNPQQTRQILTQLLTVANLIAGQSVSEQPERGISKYQIGLVNNQKLFCYMNQMNKTTVLSLNPDVAETSVSAIRRRRSIYTAGPLKEAVNNLSPTTSKLVLVNVGGAIRVADAYLNATYDNPRNPVHKTLAQLAQACDKTSVQLRTDERINNFNVHKSIDQLPPLDNVFGLLMQLSKADFTAKAKATKPQPRDGTTLGLKEDMTLNWKSGVNAASHKVYFGTKMDGLSLLAEVSKPDEVQLPELEENARYYWRVDEVWSNGTVITGDVWSFTIGKLIGWWKFDNDAKDSSGNGNDGTENGNPTYTPGKIGQAISFDGDGDRIEVPATVAGNLELYPTDAVSASAWVRTNVPSKTHYSIIRHEFHFTPLQTYFAGAQSAVFTDEDGSRGLHITRFDWSKINDGEWHHYAATYNKGIHEIWIDGTMEVSSNFGSFPLWTGDDQPWVFGGRERGEGGGEYYTGELDDVRIYNYALSAEEIEMLYRIKAVRPHPSDGATISPSVLPELSWVPAVGTVSHKVYGGTKPGELKLLAETTESNFSRLPDLQKNMTYYWRVDEILADGSIAQGDVWKLSSGKLVGWWKLDETEGSNASDSSSSDNVGKLAGNPQWQPTGGQIGGALWFDGVDDYVDCGNDASLDIAKQITIAAWVKTNDAGNSQFNPFITKGDRTYGLKHHNQNSIEFVIYDEFWQVTRFPVDGSFNGVWHHLAGTYDGSQLKLYIDGKLEVTTAYAGSIASSAANLNIATNSEESDRFYNGAIDDVRIYNYALSKGEINALYNEG